MLKKRAVLGLVVAISASVLIGLGCARAAATHKTYPPRMERRWWFVWRNMRNPKEIDRMIARFPRAQADGYNGVVFNCDIAPEKAAELREAARKYGQKLIVTVMAGSKDPNNSEGVEVRDALFVAHNGVATFRPDNPTQIANAGFERATGNQLAEWELQDDPGVTTFVDHQVFHSGQASLRMEEMGKNQYRHCRVAQPIKLQPYREYDLSAWIKTEKMNPSNPELKVLLPDTSGAISFQTFPTQSTQDWRQCHVVFNSLNNTEARLYIGSWDGQHGKMWLDDVAINEIGLVNVLRRAGTPVTVRGDGHMQYQEGADYERIVDPQLNPWNAYHDRPVIKLTAGSRIHEGERLRVGYYNSTVVYEDRVTSCLSEPSIFSEWRQEVKRADDLLHPAGFLMSHDELRVINQCALCQGRKLTPGQILADNVHKSAAIIRSIRPDAEIWVWNDMFDPMHNALPSGYYLANGPLTDSWKGLDKDVGIMNWMGEAKGKNCAFFDKLGLKQMLSGYYDGDEKGKDIATWLGNTKDVKGLTGVMYTTWADKYDAMDVWAEKAWGK